MLVVENVVMPDRWVAENKRPATSRPLLSTQILTWSWGL